MFNQPELLDNILSIEFQLKNSYSMQLYNKLSAKERAALIDEAGKDRITISFYQYHNIKNPQIFRDKLFLEWNNIDVLGRTYVSYEGINAQISVPAQNFNTLKEQLDSISFLKNIRLNVAIEQNNKSFLKLKSIVIFGRLTLVIPPKLFLIILL